MFFVLLSCICVKENYGIELELTDFADQENGKGFTADFVLNNDANYYIFGIYKVGSEDYNDKMVLLLNNEFSLSSSQKKGNSFTINRNVDMKRLKSGTFYFQLDSQDGNIFRSNQFHYSKENRSWMIKRPIGSIVIPEKDTCFISKYSTYIIIASVFLGVIILFFLIKALCF